MFRSQCRQLNHKKSSKAALIPALILLTHFCLAHNAGDPAGPHIKPGADITFSHDYDGTTKMGETETITLRFQSTSVGNRLNIRLNPGSHLQVDGPLERKFSLDKALSLTIKVSGSTPAKYYLGILAELDNGLEKSFRVFELPITIGQPAQILTKSKHTFTNENGRRIIVLDSIENRIEGQ